MIQKVQYEHNNKFLENCLIGYHDCRSSTTETRFHISQGLTSLAFTKGEIIEGTQSAYSYDSSIDNIANASNYNSILLAPLYGPNKEKIGIAQFYNFSQKDASEFEIVFHIALYINRTC